MGALPTFVPLMKVQTARHLDREIRPDEIRIRPRPVFQYESNRPVVVKPAPKPRDVISVYQETSPPMGTPEAEILCDVSIKHEVTMKELRSHSRARRIARARQEACYRLIHELGLSYPDTSKIVGYSNHTSAMAASQKWAEDHGLTHHNKRTAEGERLERNASMIRMLDEGGTVRQIAKHFGMQTASVRKIAREMGFDFSKGARRRYLTAMAERLGEQLEAAEQ